ncbi:uncharacterized protein BDW43DRAFT_311520 [Aspergillus alliaceus]|uniref:uncharacterized protein n=1 Tax=Petromyces alliaceus TaxID=209559 RepID=UPI0012A3C040|nr:uncharacterized protein BDW43DRAFT_311520 [Aspergillus alliaceus]KAB8233111.1 hypothetical protein BDW43DRAFT_311520 [Aspergillus alliaceus]
MATSALKHVKSSSRQGTGCGARFETSKSVKVRYPKISARNSPEDSNLSGSETSQLKERAAGLIYVSTAIIFCPEPEKAVDPVERGTINTLEAASRAGVQRHVLSSSSKAVEATVYDQPHKITVDTFNYEGLRNAGEGHTVESLDSSWSVYSASRAAVELTF